MLKQLVGGLLVVALASSVLAGPRVDRDLNERELAEVQRLKETLDRGIEAWAPRAERQVEAQARDQARYAELGDFAADLATLGASDLAAMHRVVALQQDAKRTLDSANNYRGLVAARLALADSDLAVRAQRLTAARYGAVRRVAEYTYRMTRDRRVSDNPAKRSQYEDLIRAARKVGELEISESELSIAQSEARRKINSFVWLESLELEDQLAEN